MDHDPDLRVRSGSVEKSIGSVALTMTKFSLIQRLFIMEIFFQHKIYNVVVHRGDQKSDELIDL